MRKLILLVTLMLTQILIKSQNTITTINPGAWSNPSTWDLGVPQTGDNIIINHSVFINVKDTINNITINQTTFCSDTLFITGVLNLEADIFSSPIVLVNNNIHKGRLGQTSRGQIIGDYVWQKWIDRCDGWGMYGGPFNTPLIDYGFFHTGFAGTQFPNFWVNTYFYDETIPNQPRDTGWVKPINVNQILSRGRGVYIFDSTSSPTNDSRVIEVIGSIDLTEDFNYNITYTGTPSFPLENGWCLVSNPYPGTIDWDAVGWTKSKMEGAIWTWNTCTDNYTSYIGGIGVNGGVKDISSGQGFWVKSNKPNPLLKSLRGVITNQNEELVKAQSHDGVVRISLNNDEIALSLNNSSTNGYDTLNDAYKFITDNSTLYTKLDSIKYSINSILDLDTIPLYVKGSGLLEFDLTELTKVPTIYYEDLETGVVYDATINPQYTFISGNVFTHRFNIIITPSITSSISEIIDGDKYLIKTINLLGQQVNESTKGFVIQFYNDGTYVKIFNN